MEQIKYAQEEIKKSRRKRDRIFWLWYLLPILFWGGERLEAWLRPVLIVSVSLLSGIVWLGLRSAVKMIPGKGKPRQ